MCRKCEPILGCKTKKHSEEECPLFQASYCPLCAQRGHFTSSCPKKAKKTVSDSIDAIPSVETNMPVKTYTMADNKEAYEEYLTLYGIEPSTRKDKNRTLVVRHLETRGLTLVQPPVAPRI